MASDLGYVQFVCDQLEDLRDVSYRKMFGEYAVYVSGKVVALVCENQLFVKPTDAGRRLLGTPAEGAPYPGAKPHFVLDEHLDDRRLLSAVFRATEAALPPPKLKKRKRSPSDGEEPSAPTRVARTADAPGRPRESDVTP